MIMQSAQPDGAGTQPQRSLGDLFRALAADSATLARDEIALARLEVTSSLRRAAGEAAGVALGVGLAAIGALVLVAGLVALLGSLLGSYWLAALLVSVLMLAAGGLGLRGALSRLRAARLAPVHTLESLRATGGWARQEAAELSGAVAGRPVAEVQRDRTARSHAARPARASAAHEPSGGDAPRRGGRGRAGEPRAAGLVPLLKRTVREIGDDDISGQAAKVAYYAFMAIPPGLMALFALAGLIGSDALANLLLTEAQMALPGDVVDGILRPFINDVVMKEAPGPLSVGALLALWGASGVFVGLADTLNVAYDVEETRSFARKRAAALGVMVVGSLLFVTGAVVSLAGPEIASALGLGRAGELTWSVLRWPVTFAFIVAAFWLAYYFLPNKDQRGCRRTLLKASAVSAGLWLLATAAFRLYISNFSSYSATYGFLGAFIILLLWLYVTGLVVLAGGELASEMEEGA